MNARWGEAPQDPADEATELDAAMPDGEYGDVPDELPMGDGAVDGMVAEEPPADVDAVSFAVAADAPPVDLAVAAPKSKGNGKGRAAAKARGQAIARAAVARRALARVVGVP